MKGEGKHVGGGIFPSVDPINLPNALVVHADDADGEPLHPERRPQGLQRPPQPRPPERDRALQVAQRQRHGARRAEVTVPVRRLDTRGVDL